MKKEKRSSAWRNGGHNLHPTSPARSLIGRVGPAIPSQPVTHDQIAIRHQNILNVFNFTLKRAAHQAHEKAKGQKPKVFG
jgi:hypothetical protein